MHTILLPAAGKLSAVPASILIVLGVLLVVEVALDIIALVDLYRRPRERVVGENKWIWLVVIILVNLLGAIIYLAVGRKPAPARDATMRPSSARAGDIVDSLYGTPEETDKT